jgi:hypothetical protein
LACANFAAADKIQPKVNDALTFAPPNSVQFHGWLGEALATCKQGRLFGQRVPDLTQPFAVREEDRMWRCEFWGKWFTSAALGYRWQADPALRKILDEAVQGLIVTQTAYGVCLLRCGLRSSTCACPSSSWPTSREPR